MSDTTVAPQGAAPPSAAPTPANEVPIDQNQTSSPNPIGSQAPPAPPAVSRAQAPPSREAAGGL
jgi:hypothetical protein